MYIPFLITGLTKIPPHCMEGRGGEDRQGQLSSTDNKMNGTIGSEKTLPECEQPYLFLIVPPTTGMSPEDDMLVDSIESWDIFSLTFSSSVCQQ